MPIVCRNPGETSRKLTWRGSTCCPGRRMGPLHPHPFSSGHADTLAEVTPGVDCSRDSSSMTARLPACGSTRLTASTSARTTPSATNPRSMPARRWNDSINRPARNTTVKLNATCTATNGCRSRACAACRPEVAFSASMGEAPEARRAGTQPEQHGGGHAQQHQETDHAAVELKVEVHWLLRRAEHAHDGGRPQHRDDRPEDARRGRQQAAFDQELLHQAPSASANREAQRHLAVASGGSRQQQIRDVRAGQQQHQRHDRRHHPERTLELEPQERRAVGGRAGDQWLVDVPRALVSGSVGGKRRRALAAKLGHDRLQALLDFLCRHSRRQPAPRAEPVLPGPVSASARLVVAGIQIR